MNGSRRTILIRACLCTTSASNEAFEMKWDGIHELSTTPSTCTVTQAPSSVAQGHPIPPQTDLSGTMMPAVPIFGFGIPYFSESVHTSRPQVAPCFAIPQTPVTQVLSESGHTIIYWAMNADKIKGSETQIASPELALMVTRRRLMRLSL